MAILVLLGCAEDTIHEEPPRPNPNIQRTRNKNFNVEFLFEKDGCRIYRFVDGGHCQYFSTCNSAFSRTMPSVSRDTPTSETK